MSSNLLFTKENTLSDIWLNFPLKCSIPKSMAPEHGLSDQAISIFRQFVESGGPDLFYQDFGNGQWALQIGNEAQVGVTEPQLIQEDLNMLVTRGLLREERTGTDSAIYHITRASPNFFAAPPLTAQAAKETRSVSNRNKSKLIFISHSSKDTDLAEAVVDLLCSSLHLRKGDFICTSVDGAKLSGGADTDETLRAAIRDVPCFLSILTPQAITSTYVLFELGARWGNGHFHIPLLAKGACSNVLKEPLKATNALRLDREAEVYQLINDLAENLNHQPEPPHALHQKVQTVVKIASIGTSSQPTQHGNSGQNVLTTSNPFIPDSDANFNLSEPARKLLIEASEATDGFVHRMSAHFGEVIAVVSPDPAFMGDIHDNRNRAKWLHAFDELCSKGYLVSTNHPDAYSVSHIGFDVADRLKHEAKAYAMRAQSKQQASHFWREFSAFMKKLESNAVYLKSTGSMIFAATIAEGRLPQKTAEDYLKQARILAVEPQFIADFDRLVDLIGKINGYLDLGAEEINKQWLGNLRSLTEELYTWILKVKEECAK